MAKGLPGIPCAFCVGWKKAPQSGWGGGEALTVLERAASLLHPLPPEGSLREEEEEEERRACHHREEISLPRQDHTTTTLATKLMPGSDTHWLYSGPREAFSSLEKGSSSPGRPFANTTLLSQTDCCLHCCLPYRSDSAFTSHYQGHNLNDPLVTPLPFPSVCLAPGLCLLGASALPALLRPRLGASPGPPPGHPALQARGSPAGAAILTEAAAAAPWGPTAPMGDSPAARAQHALPAPSSWRQEMQEESTAPESSSRPRGPK